MPRTTILLNTHNFAPSQFFNHQANSATLFNGELLFATSDGLFESIGNNDGYETVGETQVPIPIDAHIKLPSSEFGYAGQKSPRSIVMSGRFDGAMRVSLTDEGGTTKDYTSPVLDDESGCKIALDTGQRSRYLAFKIANVDGADFSLGGADLIFIPGPERRR
jgi:hypothetical protein